MSFGKLARGGKERREGGRKGGREKERKERGRYRNHEDHKQQVISLAIGLLVSFPGSWRNELGHKAIGVPQLPSVGILYLKMCMPAHLNLPSLSARSEERQVRSTENLSRFTRRIRQWIVIPICVSVCSGRKRGGREKGEEGIEGEGGKNQERKGRRQEEILNNQVLILCQYPPSPPLAPPSHRELKSLVELTCTLSSGAFTGLSLMFLVRMNPLRPFSSLVLTPIL